jgi:hypothetical protein
VTNNQEAKAIFSALRALNRIEKPSKRVKEICLELKGCLPALGYKAQKDALTKDFVLIANGKDGVGKDRLARHGAQPNNPLYQRTTGVPNAATNTPAEPRKVPNGNS